MQSSSITNSVILKTLTNGSTGDTTLPANTATSSSTLKQSVANINQSINSTAQDNAAIILKSLSNTVASTEDNTETMDLSLNRLLQATQPASIVGKIPQAMMDSRVVQARVLQNILINNAGNTSSTTSLLSGAAPTDTIATQATAAIYRVTLALNIKGAQQTIDLALPAPLPQGKWVQIELQPNGSALLRNSIPPAQIAPSVNEQQLQAGIKRSLPLQQPPEPVVKRIIELMAQPTFSKLPVTIQNVLSTLRQQWPSPQQMSEPSTLQKVLNNSGAFYEAKLQQALPAVPQEMPISIKNNAPSNPITSPVITPTKTLNTAELLSVFQTVHQSPTLVSDQKALSLELLTLIAQLIKKPVAVADEKTEFISPMALIYEKPQAHSKQNVFAQTEQPDETGMMLKEISKLLLSSLARTQLHQLDSLQTKPNQDNQTAPSATWVLEVPIQQGQRTDTLGLRIEQYASKKHKDPRTTQWVVNLTIDLEKLGQLQAQLKIRNQQAKATLWTERMSTHHLVKKHIQQLRNGLEKVGVMVEEIDVYQGLPEHVPSHALKRQLIDVRT